ncbi:hypothetical protein [Haloarcula sediminis]|uniref:hypothetical protein n=1 Tax=Haloarcula sediminis TaxID=3111777 RepID=UPI002D78D4A2|nr:hypothetical protein [Haloarcula sp. CK38]
MKRAVLLAGIVLVAMAMPTLGTVSATQTETSCDNTVTHDAFRFDNETISAASNGSATSTARNTEVRVEQSGGFVRVNATNPNGYCVAFTVELSAEIVDPAELGSIESNDGNLTADWHAVRDFEREETYTEVLVTVPPAGQTTIAPSNIRIKSLAWTGTAESAGDSLFDGLPSFGDDEDEDGLQKRTYRYNATNTTDTITINLKNDSTDRTVTEWQAMYRLDQESDWRPVHTDSEDPVFYREVGDHRVQFVFNDPDAQLRFTANPTTFDKAKSSWESWWSGVGSIGDLFGDES